MELPSDSPSWIADFLEEAEDEAKSAVDRANSTEELWKAKGMLRMVVRLEEYLELIVARDKALAQEAMEATVPKERIA